MLHDVRLQSPAAAGFMMLQQCARLHAWTTASCSRLDCQTLDMIVKPLHMPRPVRGTGKIRQLAT